MKYNIYEIDQMITLLDEFAYNDDLELTVCGMVGTDIFKYVMDSINGVYSFDRILIIDGCQDGLEILKKQIPNYMYYLDLFTNSIVDKPVSYNPWLPKIMNPEVEITLSFNEDMLLHYSVIVINNAELIPIDKLNMIRKACHVKRIIIADPFGINGEIFSDRPTLIDSLHKVSLIEAYVRVMYNVESRGIDKKVPCKIIENKKPSKRSIGRIDNTQYITNDKSLCEMIQSKQLKNTFRKNQSVLIDDDKIDVIRTDTGFKCIGRNSMCIINSTSQNNFVMLRPLYSKTIFKTYISYDKSSLSVMKVSPANILMINDAQYHHYKNTHILIGDNMSIREQYTMFKNSTNVIISHL
mgnify:CR=1 FL=1